MARRIAGCVVVMGLLLIGDANADARKTHQRSNPAPKMHRPAPEPIRIPKLSGPYAKRAKEILHKPVVHRRGAMEIYPCEPTVMEWTLEHPAYVTELWREVGYDLVPLEPLEDGFRCRDGSRSTVDFHVVHSSPEMRVVYCVGEARQAPFPALRAEMVVVHRFQFSREPSGRYYVAQQVEGYASAEGVTLQLAMMLTKGASERVVDGCLQEMRIYFTVMCQILQMRPRWSLAAVDRLEEENRIDPASAESLRAAIRKAPPPRATLVAPDEFLPEKPAER